MKPLPTALLSRWLGARAADDSLVKLALLLDVSVEELAAVPTNPRLCYRPFTVRKRDGGKRQIVAPSGPLKQLQRRLLRQYLARQPIHDAATAFRSRASIATHARRHLGQEIVLTVDLADFFPSTATRRVRRWFSELGWRGEALHVLTRLCTYRGGLPQGAPTSPALSNLVNRPLDAELSELAAMHGARYSRYCDDLAFSWGTDVEPLAFRQQVEGRLSRFDYQVQPSKGWRLQRVDSQPEITGVVLAGRRLQLPQRILERIRRLKRGWFGRDSEVRQQLAGYQGLRKMLK